MRSRTRGTGADRGADRIARSGKPAQALAWSYANILGSKLGGLVIGVVLARALGPEEFGSYAVAFVALMAILAFNDLGVSLAIVRWPDDPETIVPTVNTVTLASSVLLTGAILVAAGPFASAMGDPDSASLVRLLGLCVLINAVVASPAALLQRRFRSDLRALSDQVNIWLGAGVSLALALMGAGAMSLVVGRLAGAVAGAVLLLRFSPLPYRLGLDRSVLHRLLGFGVPLALASVVVFGIGFVDQIVVGHLLGPTLLGAYVLAFNLASWPVQLLAQPLRGVAPAVFARHQHDPDEMRHRLVRMVRPLAAVAFPMCVVLAVAAPEVIQFVYGSQWRMAAEPLRWLAIFAVFRILSELAYDYVVVAGSSRSLLIVQVIWFATLTPLVVIGTREASLGGAAAAQVLAAALVVVPSYGWLLFRLGVRPVELVKRLVDPTGGALLLAGLVWLVAATSLPDLAVLAVAGVLTLTTTGLLVHRCRSDLLLWRTQGDGAESIAPGAPALREADVV